MEKLESRALEKHQKLNYLIQLLSNLKEGLKNVQLNDTHMEEVVLY